MMDPAAGYHRADDARRWKQVGRRGPDDALAPRFGSRYRAYRRAFEAAERMEHHPDWPLHLDVDTNFTCNLACVMCPAGAGGFPASYPNKWLDRDLYRRVLDEGREHNLAALRLGITGEPLLRPDIVDWVRMARDAGVMDVMLITNAQALTPTRSAELIDAGLTRLQVSLDAVRPETYRRIRGGDLTVAVRAVENFLEQRNRRGLDLPLVRVSMIEMSLNQGEVEAFQSHWTDRADHVSIQAYANILERQETAFFPDRPARAPAFRCSEPFTRLSLLVNGDMFPCCSDFGRLAPLGRAGDESVFEVWNGSAAQRLRDLHAQGQWRRHPICRRCAEASTGGHPETER
jgi:hypothetical protein